MLFFQDDGGALTQALPGWMPEALLAMLAVLVVLGLAVVVAVWLLVSRLRSLETRAGALDGLVDIQDSLTRLTNQREDLDLRRIEHLLVDLRETQERLEDALLRAVEGIGVAHSGSSTAIVPHVAESLGERVVNRLLALGYERIQIVTRSEKLIELAAGGGEVLIEARRQGVLHKGRVVVRDGRIADVEIHPAYSIFP